MFYKVDLITESHGVLVTPFNDPIQSNTPEEAIEIVKGSVGKYVPFFAPEEFVADIKQIIVYECNKNGQLGSMVYMEPRDQWTFDKFNSIEFGKK